MQNGEKLNEIEQMMKLLKQISIIVKSMQLEISIGEEMSSYILPQMVKFKKRYLDITPSKVKVENEKIYKELYNAFLGFYEFVETDTGSIVVTLKSEALLKDDKIIKKIKKKIEGKRQFKPFEKIFNNIQIQRKLFLENLYKLDQIINNNQYEELDEIFEDHIGTLSFDNVCSINRFNKALNRKLADLEQM